MFNWIKRRSRQRTVAHELYGSIVTQARQPAFYRTFGVSDNVSGRYEMICLHLFGVLERLNMAGANDTIGRELVERFFTDMDDIMREMGVGDTTVPKKMRKASEGLYGRLDAYAKAIRADDPTGLPEALRRNIYPDDAAPEAFAQEAKALAAYTRTMVRHLEGLETPDVVEHGRISFPDLNDERGGN